VLEQQGRGDDVVVQRDLQQLEAVAQHRADAPATHDRHRHVEAAGRTRGVIDERADVVLHARVGDPPAHRTSGRVGRRRQLVGHPPELVLGAAGEQHMGTVAGEQRRRGSPDAAAAAGDNGRRSRENRSIIQCVPLVPAVRVLALRPPSTLPESSGPA
jgi:hypothetical protein